MRARRKLLIGLCIIIALVSIWLLYCPTKTVTFNQLAAAAQPDYHNTIITVSHYCGSKDGFDYFVVLPPFSREQKCRVLETDSPVNDRFAFSQDRTRWRPIHVMNGMLVTASTNEIAPNRP